MFLSSTLRSSLHRFGSPLFVVGLLFIAVACKPEPPEPMGAGDRVWILNEGNFQSGNATLDRYDPETGFLESAAFQAANQQPLGDLLQSATTFEGKTYLVVNNSQKIEVVDDSLRSLGTITGFTSPRHFLGVDAGKGYVSDLFGGAVAIVDLENLEISGSIPLPGWTEQMHLVGSTAYVTNLNADYLYLIDSQTDQLIDSMEVGPGGSSLALDAEGQLWVGCIGDFSDTLPGELYRIDPQTRSVTRQFTFAAGAGPADLQLNARGDSLFYRNEGVYVLPINATELPSTPLIPSQGSLFYGLGVDPLTSEIYVSDAVDFVQRGVILRHRPDGTEIENFRAGIIPGAFHFLP